MNLRRLKLEDMASAAVVHRASFNDRLPWLANLHTPQEDAAYFRDHVFASCTTWGGFEQDRLVAVIAFRENWIDQLYVLPGSQGRGHGKSLLAVAKSSGPSYRLWTFQRNAPARAFYDRNGFAAIEETSGQGNEEREPDVLYEWVRGAE